MSHSNFLHTIIAGVFLVGCSSTQQQDGVDALNEATGGLVESVEETVEQFLGFSLDDDEEEEEETNTQSQALVTEPSVPTIDVWEIDGQHINEQLSELLGFGFFPSGVFIDYGAYGVGNYTQWNISGLEHAHWVEFAFLAREADGSELWRIAFSDRETPTPEDQTIVEFFTQRSPGQWIIQGARVRTPGVTNGVGIYNSSELTISSSMRLQQADFDRYTDRSEAVTTTNRIFMTRVITMQTETDIWSSWIFDDIPLGQNSVPGGIVHHELHGENASITLDLLDHGENAVATLPNVEIPSEEETSEETSEEETSEEETNEEETNEDVLMRE